MDFFKYNIPILIEKVVNGFFSILFLIVRCFFYLIDFTESLFKKLAGIDTIKFEGETFGGNNGLDLVYGFITNSTVQSAFWAILSFSVVLLIIFTIVAIIKTEFTIDMSKYSKTPIIARALKSIAQFFVVPIVFIVGVLAASTLTQTVYGVFQNGNQISISMRCFKIGAYDANRARNDDSFCNYLRSNNFLASGTNPFQKLTNEQIANYIDSYIMGEVIIDGLVPVDRQGNYEINSFDYKELTKDEAIDLDENSRYVPWNALASGFPDIDSKDTPYYDFNTVNFYYDMSKFDYLLCVGASVILAGNFLAVVLSLFKRVFEMVILFIISPIPISMAPLDSGGAVTKWRGEIVKRLFAVVGPIFAYNIFLILMPLILEIELIGIESKPVFSQLFDLIALIVGASFIKTGSEMICSLLGIDDLVKSGQGMYSSALSTGAKVAAIGVGGAIVGSKLMGGAAKGVYKGTKNAFGAAKSGISGVYNYGRARYSSEGKELLKANKNINRAQSDLNKLKKQGYTEESSEYQEAERRLNDSMAIRQGLKNNLANENVVVKKYLDKNDKLGEKKSKIEKELGEMEANGLANTSEYAQKKQKLDLINKKINSNIQKSKGSVGRLERFEEGMEKNGVGVFAKAGNVGNIIGQKGKAGGKYVKEHLPGYVKELTKGQTFGNVIKNVEGLLGGTGAENVLGPIHSLLGNSKKKFAPNLGKKKQLSDKKQEAIKEEVMKQEAQEAAKDEIAARKDFELVKGIVAVNMLSKDKGLEYEDMKRALQEAIRGHDPIKVIEEKRKAINDFEKANGIEQAARDRYRKIDTDDELKSSLLQKKAELQAKADAEAAKEAGINLKDMLEKGKMKLSDEQLKSIAKEMGKEVKKGVEEGLKHKKPNEEERNQTQLFREISSGFRTLSSSLTKLIKKLDGKNNNDNEK